jgi:hypothetical protein
MGRRSERSAGKPGKQLKLRIAQRRAASEPIGSTRSDALRAWRCGTKRSKLKLWSTPRWNCLTSQAADTGP